MARAVTKATRARTNPKTRLTGLTVLPGSEVRVVVLCFVGWEAGAKKRKRIDLAKDSYYLPLVNHFVKVDKLESDPLEISVRILIFILTCSVGNRRSGGTARGSN